MCEREREKDRKRERERERERESVCACVCARKKMSKHDTYDVFGRQSFSKGACADYVKGFHARQGKQAKTSNPYQYGFEQIDTLKQGF